MQRAFKHNFVNKFLYKIQYIQRIQIYDIVRVSDQIPIVCTTGYDYILYIKID